MGVELFGTRLHAGLAVDALLAQALVGRHAGAQKRRLGSHQAHKRADGAELMAPLAEEHYFHE